MLKTFVATVACAAVFTSAEAADPFTDAVQQAYAPYRAALFKTSSGPLAEAVEAVGKASRAWASVTKQYPVAGIPYAGDPAFAADLAHITQVYQQAALDLEHKDAAAAHETLEGVRDILAGLRQRNGVVVFSDHMNAYHAQMEKVLEEGPRLLQADHGLLELAMQAGALDYLAGRVERETPAGLQGNQEFVALIGALRQSVAALRSALGSGEAAQIKAALAGLKAPYARLFVKFG